MKIFFEGIRSLVLCINIYYINIPLANGLTEEMSANMIMTGSTCNMQIKSTSTDIVECRCDLIVRHFKF